MVAAKARGSWGRELFLGDLTDAALQAASHEGLRSSSVDLEIRLGKALAQKSDQLAFKLTEQTESFDDQLAQMARAAYETALAEGVRGSFVDLELGIWKAMRKVACQKRALSACVC